MACRTGCRTKNHATWGDCARDSAMQLGDLGRGVARGTDRRLKAYSDARRQGLQPPSTQLAHSLKTMELAGA